MSSYIKILFLLLFLSSFWGCSRPKISFGDGSDIVTDNSDEDEVIEDEDEDEDDEIVEIDPCPDNYLYVEASDTFGTSAFCVMKYEARDDGFGSPISSPTNRPWFDITITQAFNACRSLGVGDGYDLMSNQEWMAMAREIESNPLNWSSGVVGSGLIFTGNVDNNFEADPNLRNIFDISDEDDPYDQTGESEVSPLPVVAGDPDGREQRRTLYLASGEVIWDVAGNVAEWVNWSYNTGTLDRVDPDNIAFSSGDGAPVFDWRNFNVLDENVDVGDDMYSLLIKPSNPTWNYEKGIGQYWAWNVDSTKGYAYRGGAYYAGWTVNGLYMLAVDVDANEIWNAEGFRCVKRLD